MTFGGPVPPSFDPLDQHAFRELPDKESGKKTRSGKRGGGGKPGRRSLRRQLALAVALSVIVGILVLGGSQPEKQPGLFVARASRPLPAFAEVTPEFFSVDEIPEQFVEPGAVAGATEGEAAGALAAALAPGARLRQDLPQGAQLHADYLTAETRIAAGLAPDERLMSVAAAVPDAAAGQIRAGDLVDVVAVTEVGGEVWPRTILVGVPVVAVYPPEEGFAVASQQQTTGGMIDSSPTELLPGDPVPGVYLLRVKAADAPLLAAAVESSAIHLALRPFDAVDPEAAPAFGYYGYVTDGQAQPAGFPPEPGSQP